MQNVSHISTNSCIHFAYKMYTKCIQHVCIQNVFHISKKCLHKTSISHFHKRLQTFCMQNLAGIVFLIFYTKCIQKFVERWYTFCIQFVYIQYRSVYTSRTFFVYQMYTQFPCGKNSETKNTTYQYTSKYQGCKISRYYTVFQIRIVSAWVLIPLHSKQQSNYFFCPLQALKNLISLPRQTKTSYHSNFWQMFNNNTHTDFKKR